MLLFKGKRGNNFLIGKVDLLIGPNNFLIGKADFLIGRQTGGRLLSRQENIGTAPGGVLPAVVPLAEGCSNVHVPS